jgi:hypothetical protein
MSALSANHSKRRIGATQVAGKTQLRIANGPSPTPCFVPNRPRFLSDVRVSKLQHKDFIMVQFDHRNRTVLCPFYHAPLASPLYLYDYIGIISVTEGHPDATITLLDYSSNHY